MKKTAFNAIHHRLGAKMVPYAGFEMPVQYSGVTHEHNVVREKVGVFDVSHMGQFRFQGENAEELIQKLTSNDVTKLEPEKAQYSTMTNNHGGIVDDLIVYMLAPNDYLMVVNAGCLDKDWAWVNEHNDLNVKITNESDDTSLLAIQGPLAVEAMEPLSSLNLGEIPFYHFKIGDFAGVENVLISATGYTGSGGFEIYFPNEYAEQVWDAVMKAGEPYGIEPCGLAARDTLRLEKGYCLYGNDINEQTTPLEAGLGWITKLNTDFTASDVLRKQKEEGVKQKLVGFEMVDRGIPRKDYPIFNENDEPIGIVTSGTQSPTLNKGIGLGYVKTVYAKPGTEIYIQVRNKMLKAEVKKLPFV